MCRRTVKGSPQTSGLGEFDNDQYFDLALMPYPPEHAFDVDGDSNSPAATQAAHAALAKFPKNVVFTDGFQGKSLVHPRADLLQELGYYKGSKQRTHSVAELRRNLVALRG